MFNLEMAIARWRRRLIAGGIRSCEIIDELESHLREEIEAQVRCGRGERQAYESAVTGLGQVSQLKTEFAKAGQGAGRRPKFLKTVYVVVALLLLLINTWTLLESDLPPLQLVLGSYFLVLFAVYLACLPWLIEWLSAAAFVRLGKALKLAGIFLWVWPCCALLEVAHVLPFKLDIVSSILVWCLFAALALTFFAYALFVGPRGGDNSADPGPPYQPKPHPVRPSGGAPRNARHSLSIV